MIVNHQNVGVFLAEQGLLSFDSVVDGDFMIVDQTSRNHNLKVVRRKSQGFFIKQIAQRNQEFVQTMTREAACYKLANENHLFRSLRSLIPKLCFYDPTNHILIVELLKDSETLWEYHQRLGSFPIEIAKLQGKRLGTYHSKARINGQTKGLEHFGRQLPWILSVHETDPMYLNQLSHGNSQLVEILQRYPDFQNALAVIKAEWKRTTLIHGDIKWENMMLCKKGDTGALDLKIIDWEIADIGDETWDAGAVIQAYLSFWVFSLPLNSGMNLTDAAASSPYSGDEIKSALAAYWLSYAKTRGFTQPTARKMLVRCMACAAARMIQTAYESVQSSPQISPYALCKLQMSMNILKDPAAAVSELMGL
jgi:hypothetical protein